MRGHNGTDRLTYGRQPSSRVKRQCDDRG